MAKKISELTAASTPGPTDTLAMVQGGATKKVTLSQLQGSINSAAFCTAGGTANALTLTTNYLPAKSLSYVSGTRWRGRVGTTNTGASTVNVDGLGIKSLVTVTGAALPAGYIRTDVDTEFTYDFVLDKVKVGRETEYGSNANGEFWKYADGRLDCGFTATTSVTTVNSSGSVFLASSPAYTFASPFISTPKVIVSGADSGSGLSALRTSLTTTTVTVNCYGASVSGKVTPEYTATGKWY